MTSMLRFLASVQHLLLTVFLFALEVLAAMV